MSWYSPSPKGYKSLDTSPIEEGSAGRNPQHQTPEHKGIWNGNIWEFGAIFEIAHQRGVLFKYPPLWLQILPPRGVAGHSAKS